MEGMKTELKNTNHQLRTGFKIALGIAIVIALLLFGLHRARGDDPIIPDALFALVADDEILSSAEIDGKVVRGEC